MALAEDLERFTAPTIAHYDRSAESFWEGTKDHDVSQNYEALLNALNESRPSAATGAHGSASYSILDLGCGPGRDLQHFRALGHRPVGLDGSLRFVEMARQLSGCEVLHQDFLHLDLPTAHFDGVFANASLFHVPRVALPSVLRALSAALRPGGVLFSSNPRGAGEEGLRGDRYGYYVDLPQWRAYLNAAGFEELSHYYRPAGRPRAEQPWLASVWRRSP
jgi:SAM-dependent methyltransferase